MESGLVATTARKLGRQCGLGGRGHIDLHFSFCANKTIPGDPAATGSMLLVLVGCADADAAAY
jgi:hypothetical protein